MLEYAQTNSRNYIIIILKLIATPILQTLWVSAIIRGHMNNGPPKNMIVKFILMNDKFFKWMNLSTTFNIHSILRAWCSNFGEVCGMG
jgi:hypothetical protein